MSSAEAADLNTLAEVVDEFTVLRLEPTGDEPDLPAVELHSEQVRQAALFIVLALGLRLLLALLRSGSGRQRKDEP